MVSFWQQNKRALIAGSVGLVAVIIVALSVPAFSPDPENPVINAKTKQTEPGKIVNPSFVLLMAIAALIPVIIMLTTKEEEAFTRKRSLVNVWKDISEPELIKCGLKHIKNVIFSDESFLIPTSDNNLFVVRVPVYNEGKNYYLALDMMEDWKMRNKDSPLHTFWKSNIGLEQAKSSLVKSTSPRFARFTQDAKSLGLSPEDIKKQVYIQQIAEAERKRREFEGGEESE